MAKALSACGENNESLLAETNGLAENICM